MLLQLSQFVPHCLPPHGTPLPSSNPSLSSCPSGMHISSSPFLWPPVSPSNIQYDAKSESTARLDCYLFPKATKTNCAGCILCKGTWLSRQVGNKYSLCSLVTHKEESQQANSCFYCRANRSML